jgi:hypothetical protein
LVEKVWIKAEEFTREGSHRSELNSAFEAAIVDIVHDGINRLVRQTSQILADDGFWRWLAVTHFRPIIERRHPAKQGPGNVQNFGIGSVVENFVYRVWLRGDIGLDVDRHPEDPYVLARRGDQDFWRSHIFRQSYGACRVFARALVTFQYPCDGTQTLKTEQMRELAKRLRRLYANVVFEYLSFDEALDLIRYEADKLRGKGGD